jgi:hypothetical protein
VSWARSQKSMKFTSLDGAKKAAAVNVDRVRNILTLEHYLLRSLGRWSELMLVAKGERGELTLEGVCEARSLADPMLGMHTALYAPSIRLIPMSLGVLGGRSSSQTGWFSGRCATTASRSPR